MFLSARLNTRSVTISIIYICVGSYEEVELFSDEFVTLI